MDKLVVQYGKEGDEIRSYKLVGAWPNSISPIGLNWESVNAIEEFNVAFSYDYWEPVVESSDKKAGGINTYGAQTNIDGVNGPN